MGTLLQILSIFFGIVTLVTGLSLSGFSLTRDPFLPAIFYSGIALIGIGISLIIVYKSDKKKSNQSSSFNILKERYAKGEITIEELDKMKKDLDNS